MLKEQKYLKVAETLTCVIRDNGNTFTPLFFFITTNNIIWLVPRCFRYTNEISDVVGEIFCSMTLDENQIEVLLNLLNLFKNSKISEPLLKGISNISGQVIRNRKLCAKAMNVISFGLKEYSKNKLEAPFKHIL